MIQYNLHIPFLTFKKSNKYIYISVSHAHANIMTISSNQKYIQNIIFIKSLFKENVSIPKNILHNIFLEKMKESGIKHVFLKNKHLNQYKNYFINS